MPPSAPAPAAPPLWPRVLAPLLLVLAGFAAYHNTFQAPFIFDDIPGIVDNSSIRQFDLATLLPAAQGGASTAGRPLVNLSLALNYAVGGKNVAGYHVFNLLVHLAAGLALYGFVRRTLLLPALRDRHASQARTIAFAVALLWIVHPLLTESVTCVIQRTESLLGLFFLLAFYCFVRAATSRGPWLVFCFACCVLGALTKEVMAAAPVLLWLFDRGFVAGTFRSAWRQRRRFHLASALATWTIIGLLILRSSVRGGTVGFGHGVQWWEYALMQCRAVVIYLKLCVWPAPLILDYGTFVERSLLRIWPQALLLSALVAATIWTLRRNPPLGFLGAWFFAILAPSSSVVPLVTQTAAEHRAYLPSIAIVAAVVLGIHAVAQRWLLPLAVALAVPLTIATIHRNSLYLSPIALWQDNYNQLPDNPRVCNNLGTALNTAEGATPEQHARGLALLEKGVAILPDYPEGHANLGDALRQAGRYQEAISHFELATKLKPDNPVFHLNYSTLLLELGRADEAVAQLETALRLDPDIEGGRFDYANALTQAGRFPEAAAQYEAALQRNPRDAEAHANYSTLLRRMNRAPEAVTHARAAVALKPDSAETHNVLGIALVSSGSTDEAIVEFRTAKRLQPGLLECRRNLVSALGKAGRFADAIEELKALQPLAPPTPEFYNTLGALHAQLGQFDEARTQFENALKVDPHNSAARDNLARLQAILRQRSP